MPDEGERRREFVCPQCGRDAEFAPGVGLRCPSCGHTSAVPGTTTGVREHSFEEFLRTRPLASVPPSQKSVRCKQCGAETNIPSDSATVACAFCGHTMVLEAVALPPQLQPEAVVPFSIDKTQCREKVDRWIKSRWFAPTALKSLAAQDRIVGVYRPYWTFDSDTRSSYRGERGDYYTETEWYTDANGQRQSREVRKTRWTSVSGEVARDFDDVLVEAGRSLEWKTNYDLGQARSYSPEFLAGWTAERYTLPPESAWQRAQGIMARTIEGDVRSDIGGDEQRVHDIRTHHGNVRFKHVLLPLYLGTYLYAGKSFRLQVNGQNGHVEGQRPYSFWKIFFFVLVLAGAIAGVILLVSLLNKDKTSSHRRSEPAIVQNFTPALTKKPPIERSTSNSSFAVSSTLKSTNLYPTPTRICLIGWKATSATNSA